MSIPQAKPRAPHCDTADCTTPLGRGQGVTVCTLSLVVSHRALKAVTETGPWDESELRLRHAKCVWGFVNIEMCANVCACLWNQGQLSGASHLVFETGSLSTDLELAKKVRWDSK